MPPTQANSCLLQTWGALQGLRSPEPTLSRPSSRGGSLSSYASPHGGSTTPTTPCLEPLPEAEAEGGVQGVGEHLLEQDGPGAGNDVPPATRGSLDAFWQALG